MWFMWLYGRMSVWQQQSIDLNAAHSRFHCISTLSTEGISGVCLLQSDAVNSITQPFLNK